jgi:hypothetical protein
VFELGEIEDTLDAYSFAYSLMYTNVYRSTVRVIYPRVIVFPGTTIKINGTTHRVEYEHDKGTFEDEVS